MYPLMLDLRARPCLLVGAGKVAHRKLVQLLAEGARVTVVAPAAIEPVERLAAERAIRLIARGFVPADVEGQQLVLSATDDRAVDAEVAAAARARGIWVNVADVPELCDLHLPATIRRGDLHLSIASGGGAPFAVRRLRQLLERRIGVSWGEWLAAAKGFRERVRAANVTPAEADARYDRFFAHTVDELALSARAPSDAEMAAWCNDGARALSQGATGHVALVGAGPGNPGLLTVEGMKLLRAADAVVYDRLSVPTLPLDLPDTVELYPVGKEPGNHPVPQKEINALLVALGRAGKRVVRLKGGDPFVFARGGEEVEALRDAGVPCQVVPGVTAGIAAAAAVGIPITFRGEAVRVTFVTAHEGGSPRVRWDLLAQDPQATLVGYMGIATLSDVTRTLIEHGMDQATPAAVVEQATLPGQRAVRAPLSEIAEAVKRSAIKPPAIFVVGPVVAHATRFDSQPRPLRGMRVALFAPAGELGQTLLAAGADVLAVPRPLTQAARVVLGAERLDGWIVQAAGELDELERERMPERSAAEMRLWCVRRDLLALAQTRGFARAITVEAADIVAALQADLVAGAGDG